MAAAKGKGVQGTIKTMQKSYGEMAPVMNAIAKKLGKKK